MDKQTLRRVYLEKRKLLTSHEYQHRNLLLNNRLKELVTKRRYKTIHGFFAIEKFKEANLKPFINWCHQQEDVQFVSSVSELNEAKMHHFLIEAETELKHNKWGIPEPVNAQSFDVSTLDCVLVPMVIGSKTGQRIGYGKGYYDRFLMSCPEKTDFIGLNLGPLLEGTIYSEAHDILMDMMLTPFQTFHIAESKEKTKG